MTDVMTNVMTNVMMNTVMNVMMKSSYILVFDLYIHNYMYIYIYIWRWANNLGPTTVHTAWEYTCGAPGRRGWILDLGEGGGRRVGEYELLGFKLEAQTGNH